MEGVPRLPLPSMLGVPTSGYALSPTYSDDELDYLFALTEDQVLKGTYSQYLSPKLMWDAILRHRDRIKKERPGIYAKIQKNRELTLKRE